MRGETFPTNCFYGVHLVLVYSYLEWYTYVIVHNILIGTTNVLFYAALRVIVTIIYL